MPSGTIALTTDSGVHQAELRWSTADDPGTNSSTVTAQLWGRRTSGTGGGAGSWNIIIDGTSFARSATVALTTTFSLLTSAAKTVVHTANGTKTVVLSATGGIPGTSWDTTTGSGSAVLTNYVVPPPAPTGLGVLWVTPVEIAWRWVDPYGGGIKPPGSPTVSEYELRWSTNPTFATGTLTLIAATNTANTTPLNPATTYYASVRASNTDGWGPWSPPVSQTTLPSGPPTLLVDPADSGLSTTLYFTPPGGVTGVDRYQWQRWDESWETGDPGAAAVLNGDVYGTSTIVGDAGVGRVYQWRARAQFGRLTPTSSTFRYTSPWSDWQAVTQPQANVGAGDYFDGNSISRDLVYSWTGAADGSTSIATGVVPIGWAAEPVGGEAVVWQVSGGYAGQYAARITILTDCTGAGSRFGQEPVESRTAEITEDATFFGSIHVRLSRQNRVAAELSWLDVDFALLGREQGEAQLVAAGSWVRLWVGGLAPSGAAHAVISIIDVTGTGHSTWRGGDTVDLDAAMVSLGDVYPYFDGDTTDTAEYEYAWFEAGLENASASSRSPVRESVLPGGPVLIDPLCPPPPAPPRPPTIPNPCIETSGIWRRSYRNIAATDISDWLGVVPTFELVTLSAEVRQVRIRIYPNPDNEVPELIDPDSWMSEQIVSYIPADTVFTIDGVTQRAWATVGETSAVSADHLLYGSNGTPPVWPVLSCGISYLISVDMPIEVPQAGSFLRGYLTTRT